MHRLLYVGNLVSGVTTTDLRALFEAFGSVECAQVIQNFRTGRSKGFGYVEMGTEAGAVAAIAALHAQDHSGRCLLVNEVTARTERGCLGSAGHLT